MHKIYPQSQNQCNDTQNNRSHRILVNSQMVAHQEQNSFLSSSSLISGQQFQHPVMTLQQQQPIQYVAIPVGNQGIPYNKSPLRDMNAEYNNINHQKKRKRKLKNNEDCIYKDCYPVGVIYDIEYIGEYKMEGTINQITTPQLSWSTTFWMCFCFPITFPLLFYVYIFLPFMIWIKQGCKFLFRMIFCMRSGRINCGRRCYLICFETIARLICDEFLCFFCNWTCQFWKCVFGEVAKHKDDACCICSCGDCFHEMDCNCGNLFSCDYSCAKFGELCGKVLCCQDGNTCNELNPCNVWKECCECDIFSTVVGGCKALTEHCNICDCSACNVEGAASLCKDCISCEWIGTACNILCEVGNVLGELFGGLEGCCKNLCEIVKCLT